MRKCDVCGSSFQAVRAWQKRCSSRCNSVSSKAKKRADPSKKRCRTCGSQLPVEKFITLHHSCMSCEKIKDAGMKRCNHCDEVKERDLFSKRSARPDGLDSTCKECRSQQFKQRNATPEARLKNREYKYRRKYGIGVADVEMMLRQQRHQCGICEIPIGESNFHVDHNHKTGAVRSLLCFKCNALLGHASEDETVLLSAIDYLRRHGS